MSITYKNITVKVGDIVKFNYGRYTSEPITQGIIERVEEAGDEAWATFGYRQWDIGFYLSDGRRFSLEAIVDENMQFEIITE